MCILGQLAGGGSMASLHAKKKFTNVEILTRLIKVTYRAGLGSKVRICPDKPPGPPG